MLHLKLRMNNCIALNSKSLRLKKLFAEEKEIEIVAGDFGSDP